MSLANILRDCVTAIRGGASEIGEAVVDSQAIRILEQEIRDAKDGIANAKVNLSKLKSREVGLKRQLTDVEEDLVSYTAAAKEALGKGNEDLAREIAEKIGTLRGEKTDLSEQHSILAPEVNKILSVIQSREKQINKNEGDLEKAKTIEELNKTSRAISSAMPTTENSAKRVQRALDRVKKKHTDFENQQDAEQWLADAESGADLDKKIAAAGIGSKSTSSADDILNELR